MEGNSRQSKLMHIQIQKNELWKRQLWMKIIEQKINNQAKLLAILGKDGLEEVALYSMPLTIDNVDSHETQAAKNYFNYYYPGLNRSTDSPINSRLDYGYAIVRSAIIRSLASNGFHPAIGIHHDHQLNAFNLADDLIEPFRAIVDQVAYANIGESIKLKKQERKIFVRSYITHV